MFLDCIINSDTIKSYNNIINKELSSVFYPILNKNEYKDYYTKVLNLPFDLSLFNEYNKEITKELFELEEFITYTHTNPNKLFSELITAYFITKNQEITIDKLNIYAKQYKLLIITRYYLNLKLKVLNFIIDPHIFCIKIKTKYYFYYYKGMINNTKVIIEYLFESQVSDISKISKKNQNILLDIIKSNIIFIELKSQTLLNNDKIWKIVSQKPSIYLKITSYISGIIYLKK